MSIQNIICSNLPDFQKFEIRKCFLI